MWSLHWDQGECDVLNYKKNVKFYTIKKNVKFNTATNENVMPHIDKKGNFSSKVKQNVKFRYQNNDYKKFCC